MSKLTPKENYLRMLRKEIPEYVPIYFQRGVSNWVEDLLTPRECPDGPITTTLGVTYVGCPDLNNGATPMPGKYVITDITKWRDQLKIPDFSDFDFEDYYRKKMADVDRENQIVPIGGSDYFLTLVALMGFEDTMLALYTEPEEVHALLEYISEFYVMVLKKQLQYVKPDTCTIMDDDSAYRAPFFSVEVYQEFFKPYQQKHCDLCLENGVLLERHDCGKSEQFIPDWIDMGITAWNPAQVTNDLANIKKTYGNQIAICGGWDGLKYQDEFDEEVLRAALDEYVNTLAPGGGFTFSVMMPAKKDDPRTVKRSEFLKKYYEENVRDYYKTH